MKCSDAITTFVLCDTLEEVWATLTAYLSELGFDRAIFGHRDSLSEENFHNQDSMVLFSTYGDALNRALVDRRLYMHSPTVRWALRNQGWISWGATVEKMDADDLSEEEKEVVNLTRSMGLTAGWTYSVPFRPDARYRSVFGLAVPDGQGQEVADAILREMKEPLETVLLAFALAVLKFEKVRPSERLSPTQIKTLSLLAEGRTLAEIAELEGVHWRTIDKRLAASRKVLAANNSLHAVVLAERSGQLIVVRE